MARTLLDASAAAISLHGAQAVWMDLAPELEGAPCPLAAGAEMLCMPGHAALQRVASVSFGPDGRGVLGVFDTQARECTAAQHRHLEELGRIAAQCLALWERAEQAARKEAFFRQLIESSVDTTVFGDLEGRRQYISPSVTRLLGYEPQEMLGRQAVALTHPEDVPGLAALLQQIRRGELEEGVIEIRQRHKNGEWIWMEARVHLTRDEATGAPTGYVSSVRATGQRKEKESHLARLASHDTLTDLPNRRLFTKLLPREIERSRRAGQRLMLLYMDLDGFKQVNDRFGHPAGDEVLREVARRLCGVMRGSDLVARLGGDEFTALIQAHHLEDGATLSRRLIDAMAQPFRFDGGEAAIGLSIGIASVSGTEAVDAQSLLAQADQALYAAKRRQGKNTFCFFE